MPLAQCITVLVSASGAPRLPGFHACVGGGGEKQTPEWYKEKGKASAPTHAQQLQEELSCAELC